MPWRSCDELLVAKNGTDGVYDDDPNKNPDTRRFDVDLSEALRRDLKGDGSAGAVPREWSRRLVFSGMGEDRGCYPRADGRGTLATALI